MRWLHNPAITSEFAPPPAIRPSEWIAENIVLTPKESARTGAVDWSNSPWSRALVDVLAHPRLFRLVGLKGVQVGLTAALRWWIAASLVLSPGPTQIVYPDQAAATDQVQDYWIPMIRNTPPLAAMIEDRDSLAKTHLRLRPANITLGYSGAEQSISSNPIEKMIKDELANWRNEAYMSAVADKRTVSFERTRKIAAISTPLNEGHDIDADFQATSRAWFWCVPCLDCARYAWVTWSQIRFPARPDVDGRPLNDDGWGNWIEDHGGTTWHCPHCAASHAVGAKYGMNLRGAWLPGRRDPETQRWEPPAPDAVDHAAVRDLVDAGAGEPTRLGPFAFPDPDTGELVDASLDSLARLPLPRTIGIRKSGLTGFESWDAHAVEFVKSKRHPRRLQVWTNKTEGAAWQDQRLAVSAGIFRPKIAAGHPARRVPEWASLLLAGIDTQHDYFLYVLRAYGHHGRSRLIDLGRADSFEDLERQVLRAHYPVVDAEGEDMPQVTLSCRRAIIDAGGGEGGQDTDLTRTDEVYVWAGRWPQMVFAAHGMGGRIKHHHTPLRVGGIGRGSARSTTKRKHQGNPGTLMMVDTFYFKEQLFGRHYKSTPEEDDCWELHAEVPEDYCRQLVAEHKVIDKNGVESYRLRTAGAANHYLDCEVYLAALAMHLHVDTLPPLTTLRRRRNDTRSRTGLRRGGLRKAGSLTGGK
jgi:phage terminase large subunit GpA-like protein